MYFSNYLELSSFNESNVIATRNVEQSDINTFGRNVEDKEDNEEADEFLISEDLKALQVTNIFKLLSKTLEENGDDLVPLYLAAKDKVLEITDKQSLVPIIQASLKDESLQQYSR